MGVRPTPTIQHNRWFGHYNPAKATGNANASARVAFLRAARAPVTSGAQVQDALMRGAEVAPSLGVILTGGERQGVEYVVTDQIPVPAYADSVDGSRIYFPHGQSLAQYLREFIGAGQNVAALPEGCELPPAGNLGSPIQTSWQCWEEYYWRNALGVSLLFQAAIEFDQADVPFGQAGREPGLLNASERVFFRVMREEGLRGIVRVYADHMINPALRDVVEEHMARRTAHIMHEGLLILQSWLEPQRGERPDLPRTILDAQVEAALPFERGVEVDLQGTDRLAHFDRQRLLSFMTLPMMTEEDLPHLFSAFRRVAPQLAAQWMPHLEVCRPLLRVVAAPMPQPILLRVDVGTMLGVTQQEKSIEILVQQGATIRQILPDMANLLARLTVPPSLQERIPIDAGDHASLVRSLERIYARLDMWGYSGYFAFLDEAAKRGLGFPISDHHAVMRHMLHSAGFGVLVENWDRFTNPDATAWLRIQLREVVQQLQFDPESSA
jgi:hypothetical protein